MRRNIIFVILKIIEISIIVFGPYYLGLLSLKWNWYICFMGIGGLNPYATGICTLFILILVGIVVLLTYIVLYCFCFYNMGLATKLDKKLSKK